MSDEADQEVPTRRTRGAGPADLADTEKSADDPALAHTALAELPIGANREVSLVPTAPRTQLTREQPGRYVPGRELGRGGMGRVGLVFDTVLGREVALKELLGGERVAADGLSIGVVTRFLREARITGQLEHPGIVPVYELGQRDDGTLYYTMKAIRGRSLAAELREAREPADRLALMGRFRDVCEAVAYAHSRGVVHRDLKPDNVMVGEFGETLVVDWGIAKVRGEDETRPPSEHDTRSSARPLALLEGSVGTLAGHAIGTPAYMSPEQARGELASIDERSDVWGLGAILFEILTGRAPFTGQNAREVLHRVLEESPPRVRTIAPDAPPELAAIADRALSRDPTSRYPGAREVAAEIAAWQEDGQVRAY